MRFANRSLGIATMSDNPAPVDLDHRRVRYLVQLLRRRTPEEVVIGALLFAPAFTPEMREALRLLHLERSTEAVHNAAPTARLRTFSQPEGSPTDACYPI
jgi:hypothetical protein